MCHCACGVVQPPFTGFLATTCSLCFGRYRSTFYSHFITLHRNLMLFALKQGIQYSQLYQLEKH